MPFYKKKPVIVEAHQLTSENCDDLIIWCGGNFLTLDALDRVIIEIPTLEGRMRSHQGDYIVKGNHGEFWSVKQNIFEDNYELVG